MYLKADEPLSSRALEEEINEDDGSPSLLTPREVEVLTLVAEGRSSKEVSEQLFISKRTVDFHLSNIYTKLGASNRVQALLEASRRGLLPGRLSVP